jgi:hypothetical protein
MWAIHPMPIKMIITADSIDDHLQATPFPAQPHKNVSPFQCWNTSRSKLPSILEQVSMWQDRNNWTEHPIGFNLQTEYS